MIAARHEADVGIGRPVVLVTGASGMVGRAVVQYIVENRPNWRIIASVRSTSASFPSQVEVHSGMLLQPNQDWSQALADVTHIVHCAARVHVMQETERDAEAVYHETNVQGTMNLASQAAKAGIARFIFLSSVKVNGEKTEVGKPFLASDTPNPQDSYGQSKADAERQLMALGKLTGMQIVVIRPPLVYGPGVKANFAQMVRFVKMGWPLPLKSIKNQRSLVALPNLVDLIACCIEHQSAQNQIFLVSDNDDVSTSDLFRLTAFAMRQKSRLVDCPPWLLRFCAAFVGRSSIADRLCDSLQVDIRATREALDWTPVVTVKDALKATVEGAS